MDMAINEVRGKRFCQCGHSAIAHGKDQDEACSMCPPGECEKYRSRSNIELIDSMPPERPEHRRPADKRRGPVSKQERDRFAVLERTITKALDSDIEKGRAILEIVNKKLYRAGGFSNIRQWLNARREWGIKVGRADQLMNFARARANVEKYTSVEHSTNVLPRSEAQTRPLNKYPDEDQARAWNIAVERAGGVPTGEIVREVVEDLFPQDPQDPQRIQDKRNLFQEVCSRIDQFTAWRNSTANPEDMTEEARKYFQRLLEAVRDWLKF